MNLYPLGLTVSNLCALLTAIPALLDISYDLGGGSYFTAFYQVMLHLLCGFYPPMAGSPSVAPDQFLLCQLCLYHHLYDSQPVHRYLQADRLPKVPHDEERMAVHQPILHRQRHPPHPTVL